MTDYEKKYSIKINIALWQVCYPINHTFTQGLITFLLIYGGF